MTSDSTWREAPCLAGRYVRLEPLEAHHAPGYLAAAGAPDGDPSDVFRWNRLEPPRDLATARAQIADALAARDAGDRTALAQLDAESGEFIGTTSLYEVDAAKRSLAIGHTWIGRPWQRTGVNTESKLLLLTHAFETLGAVRVVWHVDSLNQPSRAAVSRLGATQEGILRKDRQRRDGTWRDTVLFSMLDDEWPQARDRLRLALESNSRRSA